MSSQLSQHQTFPYISKSKHTIKICVLTGLCRFFCYEELKLWGESDLEELMFLSSHNLTSRKSRDWMNDVDPSLLSHTLDGSGGTFFLLVTLKRRLLDYSALLCLMFWTIIVLFLSLFFDCLISILFSVLIFYIPYVNNRK